MPCTPSSDAERWEMRAREMFSRRRLQSTSTLAVAVEADFVARILPSLPLPIVRKIHRVESFESTTRINRATPDMKHLKLLLTLSIAALVGCASTSDIDMTKVESNCGQGCTRTYSECLGKFTFFPIQAQHQCTDAMRLCANSCPVRSPQSTSSVLTPR